METNNYLEDLCLQVVLPESKRVTNNFFQVITNKASKFVTFYAFPSGQSVTYLVINRHTTGFLQLKKIKWKTNLIILP